MPRIELKLYVALGVLLTVWFAAIHLSGRVLPKELLLGAFFAAATFVPVIARGGVPPVEVVATALCFAALCSLNCCFLCAWEAESGSTVKTHQSVQLTIRYMRVAAALPALIALLTALLVQPPHHLVPLAVASGCVCLLLLHRFRRRVEATTLRSLADVALLTPLLFAFWLR